MIRNQVAMLFLLGLWTGAQATPHQELRGSSNDERHSQARGLVEASFGDPQPMYPISFEGIEPDAYPGNFVASDDDQVCYELEKLGYIGEVTGEMRGLKIDPPVDFDDDYIAVTLSGDGNYLAWATESGAKALAFVVKGGPNYHVYDYVDSGIEADSWLVSPKNRNRIPAISHYNVCYSVDGGTQGCTPGYWRNHADRWLGVAPTDNFDTTFGVDLFDPDITLCMAVSTPQTYGTFAFHAVAALLNAYGGTPNADGTKVDYPYTVAQVKEKVQNAVLNGTQETTKNQLAAANELGCPLEGTRGVACS